MVFYAMNEIIIQKFGGSSLATLDDIRRCAKITAAAYQNNSNNNNHDNSHSNNNIVVVVSARGHFTDELLIDINSFSSSSPDIENSVSAIKNNIKILKNYKQNNHSEPNNIKENNIREKDLVLAAGEQISAGLFVLALNEIGIKAVALTGWQVPINSDGNYGNANIINIETEKIHKYLEQDYVIVITGFQGVYKEDITTLGRGGSDITAVALAVTLKAKECDIYTDVEGVFPMDPTLFKDQRPLKNITYQELSEMALGPRVLHSRAIDLAASYNQKVRIFSSFSVRAASNIMNSSLSPRITTNQTFGTEVTRNINHNNYDHYDNYLDNQGECLEKLFISGITAHNNRVKLKLITASKESTDSNAAPKANLLFLEFLNLLYSHSVSIDIINLNADNITIIAPKSEIEKLATFLPKLQIEQEEICLIYIVGSSLLKSIQINIINLIGMLKLKNIEVKFLNVTEVKLIIGINNNEVQDALELLYSLFNFSEIKATRSTHSQSNAESIITGNLASNSNNNANNNISVLG